MKRYSLHYSVNKMDLWALPGELGPYDLGPYDRFWGYSGQVKYLKGIVRRVQFLYPEAHDFRIYDNAWDEEEGLYSHIVCRRISVDSKWEDLRVYNRYKEMTFEEYLSQTETDKEAYKKYLALRNDIDREKAAGHEPDAKMLSSAYYAHIEVLKPYYTYRAYGGSVTLEQADHLLLTMEGITQ